MTRYLSESADLLYIPWLFKRLRRRAVRWISYLKNLRDITLREEIYLRQISKQEETIIFIL